MDYIKVSASATERTVLTSREAWIVLRWLHNTNPYVVPPTSIEESQWWTQKAITPGEALSPASKLWTESQSRLELHCWFPVLLSIMLAVAPWIRLSKRFSLRTLLIATTLVAVVLGLVVWAARK